MQSELSKFLSVLQLAAAEREFILSIWSVIQS
jgi:hypothetical protein